MSEEQTTYRFGPLERRGLAGPLRPAQLLTLGLALAAVVAVLDLAPNGNAAMLGVVVLLAVTAAALVPIAGATAVEWLPVGFVHGLRRVRERPRPQPAVTAGFRLRRGERSPAPPLPWPGRALSGVALRDIPHRGRSLGALAEHRGKLLTAVLACQVSAFQLLDADEQERRLQRWGAVLAGCAGTPVRRLQWLERTAPTQADELAGWLHTAGDPELLRRREPPLQSYLELIDGSAPAIHDHEILLAVQVDAGQRRGTEQLLIEQTERIAGGLAAAEVHVLGALSAEQLANALRTCFDPFARAELAARRAARASAVDPAATAVPLAVQERWDSYRCDGALHATFWIAGWPRVDVGPSFLSSLLAPSGSVRTASVCFEPVPPERSTREIEAAITRDRADRDLRQRFGQSETARQRLAQEAALRREAELAAGHSEVRFSGFITVSGRDEDELRFACQEVTQHAALARLELRRLYGRQAEAFTFTLPLARGLA